ncbi:MAG: hypothetical protein RMM28_02385 [Thermoleophilia bacterium]|nr:hypothetical protein [Thermoleophilia bacterium]
MAKGTASLGLGSLASGALTALSLLVVTLLAAVVGVVIAREFGRTAETDGFFAAYGVFVVVVLAAQAIRIAVIPELSRARVERRLASELASFALAISALAIPLAAAGVLLADPLAHVLTGASSDDARVAAADALRWMLPAAAAHLYAGLAASGLAAYDDYLTAAVGYAAGSAAGLALILLEVRSEGIVTVAWGMALNAAVALLVPTVGLVWRAYATRMPARALRPGGAPFPSRLGLFLAAASLPVALQLCYVVCLPFAGRLGEGAATSFGYAYLAGASVVTVAAFSLSLVTSAPLARVGLDAARAARHVIASSWIALVLVGAATGVLALAGGEIVEAVLGSAYGGEVGGEVAALVVVLAPWMVASVGLNVTFPLAFVVGRTSPLPAIGVALLAGQVGLAFLGSALLGLDGLALALALSTAVALGLLLRLLGALRAAVPGILLASGSVAALAGLAFAPASFLLGSTAAGIVGLALYALLVAATRPRGLRTSWSYLRALG